MELKSCPVCGCKPLLLSDDEVMCINGLCPVHALVTKKMNWNKRADVIGRDSQIRKEIELEHSLKNNMNKIRLRFPEITD